MRLHGSWRRTGLLGYLGIVLAFYVSHTKDASALLGQGIYGGIYLARMLATIVSSACSSVIATSIRIDDAMIVDT